MSIRWTEAQRRRVQEVLDRHPIQSGRCAETARQLLPVAMSVDASARARLLRPKDDAPFILSLEYGHFYHHVATEMIAHMVDALSGSDGVHAPSYLSQYWRYPTEIEIIDADLGDLSL